MAHLSAVSGQLPGPAAVGGTQPNVVLGHENDEITVNVRVTQVSG